MIIDQKAMIPPPPPYLPPPPPFSEIAPKLIKRKGQRTTFSTLPSHLLLQVVYSTFPQSDGQYEGEGKIERQRENLHWLVTSLRLVNRAFYIASMHILRSTYIPAYDSLIRPPYSSDPFPSSVIETDTIIISTHREIVTLDHFIALLAHEDLYLDATSLHLPREEAYKDLFDLAQPRSRLEDLVKEEGLKSGLIYLGEQPPPLLQPPEEDANRPVVDPVAVTPVRPIDPSEPKDTLQPAAPPSPTPSPTKTSFNPFSKSSYLALAKSKIRRDRSSSNTPPSPVTTPTSLIPCSPVDSKAKLPRISSIPFTYLSISFSPRKVALVYTLPVGGNSGIAYPGADFGSLSMSVTGPTGPGGRTSKRTLVELARSREEKLEVTAKRIVRGLEDALLEDI